MSTAPNPGQILDFITILDQGFQTGQPFASCLRQSLHQLLDVWPSTEFVRVYRPNQELLVSTDETRTLAIPDSVWAASAPLYEEGVWFVPLIVEAQTLGLLEIKASELEAENWLRLVATHLAQALARDHEQAIYEQQAQVFNELSIRQSVADMLAVLQQHLLYTVDAVPSIVGLQYDAQGQVAAMGVLASGWEQPFGWDWDTLGAPLRATIQSGPALVATPNADLGAALLGWLGDNGVQQVVIHSLIVEGQSKGLLVIDNRAAAGFSRAQQVAFQRVAERLSMLLHTHSLLGEAKTTRNSAENLVLSNRLITTADGYNDMVQAAMYTLAQHMTAVALTVFESPLDATHTPASRTVVALGVADGPVTLAETPQMPLMLVDEQLKNLWQGLPVVMSDDDISSGIAVYSDHIGDTAITWLAAFGLRAGDQLLGTLEVLNAAPYALSPEEIDAYTMLADQIGISIQNQQLLSETTGSLEEVRQLYVLNQAMIEAQDTLDVLRGLRGLATNAVRISHTIVEYDSEGRIQDIVVQHILTHDQEQVVHQSLAAYQSAEALTVEIEYWQQPRQTNVFINDTANPPDDFPSAMASAAQHVGVGSYVLMPISQGDRLRDIVRIAFPAPQTFSPRLRRLYDAAHDQITVVFQSLWLLQEAQNTAARLEQQVSVLQSLNELSTVISIAQDEQQLLHQSAQALVTALGVTYCRIMLLDSSQERGTVFCDYPHRGLAGQPFALADLPVASQIGPDNPMPLVVNDVKLDERVDAQARETLKAEGVHAFMLMPLFVRGQLVGLIRLDMQREDRIFTPEVLDVAQTILAQVVVGLQSIRLLDEARRRSEQLQRASQFGQTLQSTLDMAVILTVALGESRQMIPMTRMSIALYDFEADCLRTAALYANGEDYVTPVNGAEVDMSGSIVGRAWQTGDLVHIPDVIEAEDSPADDVPELRAVLVMPLVTRSGTLGVVSVGDGQPHVYGNTDIIVFQQMMAQFAAAIENATLYERSQRQARNEALVNSIATRLQQQSDIESMLTIAASDLGRALGARRARIRLGTRTLVEQSNGADER